MIENHAAFLADFGVDVERIGHPDFRALFDVTEGDAFGSATVSDRDLSYPVESVAPDLVAGEVITIAGSDFRVTKEPARRVDDGAWAVVKVVAL